MILSNNGILDKENHFFYYSHTALNYSNGFSHFHPIKELGPPKG